MEIEFVSCGGLLLFGASVVALAVFVWWDLPALIAHVVVGAAAVWAFPDWTSRAIAFVSGNLAGIAAGLLARRWATRSKAALPEDAGRSGDRDQAD